MSTHASNLQGLLSWATAQQSESASSPAGLPNETMTTSATASSQLPDPRANTGVLDALFGPSEPEIMKSNLSYAVESSHPLENRIEALDNFEMLVESIDNANLIESMKMWPALVKMMADQEEGYEIRGYTFWVSGTAIQNNPKSQMAFLKHGPMKCIVEAIRYGIDSSTILDLPESAKIMRSRALYCLSALLRHNGPAIEAFADLNGFSLLRDLLSDCQAEIRRKAAFLIHSLIENELPLRDTAQHAAFENHLADLDSNPPNDSVLVDAAGESSVPAGAPLEIDANPPIKGPKEPILVSIAQSGIPHTLVDAMTGGPNAIVDPNSSIPYLEIVVATITSLLDHRTEAKEGHRLDLFSTVDLSRLKGWLEGEGDLTTGIKATMDDEDWTRFELAVRSSI